MSCEQKTLIEIYWQVQYFLAALEQNRRKAKNYPITMRERNIHLNAEESYGKT